MPLALSLISLRLAIISPILTRLLVRAQDETPLQIFGSLSHPISTGGRFGEDEMIIAGNADGGVIGGTVFMLLGEDVRLPGQVVGRLFRASIVIKEEKVCGAAGREDFFLFGQRLASIVLELGIRFEGGKTFFYPAMVDEFQELIFEVGMETNICVIDGTHGHKANPSAMPFFHIEVFVRLLRIECEAGGKRA